MKIYVNPQANLECNYYNADAVLEYRRLSTCTTVVAAMSTFHSVYAVSHVIVVSPLPLETQFCVEHNATHSAFLGSSILLYIGNYNYEYKQRSWLAPFSGRQFIGLLVYESELPITLSKSLFM